MSLEEALAGKEIPEEVRKNMALVPVPYFSFEGASCTGQLVVHAALVADVETIFGELYARRFPIHKIVPVVAYGWDDDASMADNNTSAFNYRVIFGTDRLSNHSFGCAIDVNPMQNPYTQRDGRVVPLGASYDPSVPGTVTDEIAQIFKSHGFEWGGEWQQHKDWQHFEKLV